MAKPINFFKLKINNNNKNFNHNNNYYYKENHNVIKYSPQILCNDYFHEI